MAFAIFGDFMIDIDSLTLGQLKEIQSCRLVNKTKETCDVSARPVIVRCRDAGVWFGYYAGHDGREVRLMQARRMYAWKPAQEATLSGCANYGIDQAQSKITRAVSKVTLLEACEIIDCTEIAEKSIDGAPCAS
jgi:hypothetical protein